MQTRILLLGALSLASGVSAGQNVQQFRIDPDVQRQRDQTRVTILQDELVTEALALAEVQKLFRADAGRSDTRSAQESSRRIAGHRQNISALAKELALIERQAGTTKSAAPSTAEKVATEPVPLAQVLRPAGTGAGVTDERRASTGRPEWVISGSEIGRTP